MSALALFHAKIHRGNEMKTLLLLVGIIVCAAGILFAGQGLGYITWECSRT